MPQIGAPLTDFSEDKLNLESFADNLTSIVVSQFPHPTNEYSMVIALDSGWGTGKTSFINMWTKKLETDPKLICLTYNAWENDDFPNALVPILCSFQRLIGDDSGKEEGLKYCISVALNLFPVSVSFTCEKSPDKILEDFSVRQQRKEILEKLIRSIRGKHDYLLICIDELDRCRPTFAIETLEVVKHFFDIPNVIFVFSLDMKQLSNSIKVVYGDIDSAGYLRRFFDYIRPLPEPTVDNLFKFLRARNEYLSGEELCHLVNLSKPFCISLRTFNVICAVYKRFKRYTEYNHTWDRRWLKDPIYYKVYLTLIALKYSKPHEYRSFIQNGTDFDKQNDIISPDVKKLLRDLFCVKRFESCYTKRIANSSIAACLLRNPTCEDPLWDEVENHFFVGDEGLINEKGGVYHSIDDWSLSLCEYIDRNIEESWAKAVHQFQTVHTVMNKSFLKIKEGSKVYGLERAFVDEGGGSICFRGTKKVNGTEYDVIAKMNDNRWCVDTYVNGEYVQYLTYNNIGDVAEKLALDEVIKEVTKKFSDGMGEAIGIYQKWDRWKTKSEDFFEKFEKNKQTMDKEFLFTGLTEIYSRSWDILTKDEIKWLCELTHRLGISMQDLKEICAVYIQFKTNQSLRNYWVKFYDTCMVATPADEDSRQKFYDTYMTLIAMSQFKAPEYIPEDILFVLSENPDDPSYMDYIIPFKYESLIVNGTNIIDEQNDALREIYTKVFGYKDKSSGSLLSCYTKEVADSDWYDPNTWVSSVLDNINKDQLTCEIKKHFIDMILDPYSANDYYSLFSARIMKIVRDSRKSAKDDNYIVKIRPKKLEL